MAYFLNLFSPETAEAFAKSNQSTSGFRLRQKNAAEKVQVGDKLICYMTKLSRWVGIFEVRGPSFIDDQPIFHSENDPYVVRLKVEPIIFLSKEKGIPIHEDKIWTQLSFTRDFKKHTSLWTGKVRSSLVPISDEDGRFLEDLLIAQAQSPVSYEIEPGDLAKITRHQVRTVDKVLTVTVPEKNENVALTQTEFSSEVRESFKVQASLAKIGESMGMKIWLPRADRTRVCTEWKPEEGTLLDRLPLNYDETTLKTIEQIDLIWFKGRSIVRAFEVEHTTSIYSGILRMADLIALQPNMNINLHIVAPSARREKVFQEISRPVFAFMDKPLAEICTYISYESLEELAQQKHLAHLVDSVLDEYSEEAD